MLRRDRELARTTRRRLTALTAPVPAASSTVPPPEVASPGTGWVPDRDRPALDASGVPPVPAVRTTTALRVAAESYAASHGDPTARAPAPRRRVRWTVPWRLAVAAGGVILLVGGAVAVRATSLAPGPAVVLPTPAPAGPVQPGPSPSGVEVVVDVVGAVAVPGVVRLPAGARVVDALAAAGGATVEAQVSALNLARVLVDGEQIAVPRPGEVVTSGAGTTDAADALVDLNTADAAALDALPGIGPVLADRIVAHRADGPFGTVDELADVAGIGPTLLERLRALVRV